MEPPLVVEAVREHLTYVVGEVQAEVVAVGEPLPDTGRLLEATFGGEHLRVETGIVFREVTRSRGGFGRN